MWSSGGAARGGEGGAARGAASGRVPLELVGQRWAWSCTATKMAQGVGAEPWCPMPPRSLERESSPRGEVVQAAPAPPTFQGPPAHLWMMPSYVDLTDDDDDNGGA
ncbi:histone-lysine n-methyltransferase atxr3 [Hordeum vulgare]|nr:histone-lysine n-methyltransferase atxr3 [Hordeum vulgare]